MKTSLDTSRSQAEALDRADPLAPFRERFVIADPSVVYLDGNSLGRLPRATAQRLARVVADEWGAELIRAWDGWLDLPVRIGDLLATTLLGARPDEVILADSTTVNFHRLATAALDAQPDRRAIVTDRANFPTDRYALEGIAGARGLEIRWLEERPNGPSDGGPEPAEVAGALDGQVALVTLCHVDYRSAAIADMAAVNAAAHDAGALTLWDCCHSVGAIPVELDRSGADLAVGCTYKYLNAGPGAPAFLYVRRELQDRLRNPIQGWFGQRDQFAMGPSYESRAGIAGWLVGTPPILGLAAVDEGVRLVAEAGIGAIREKSIALTEYAIELFDAWLSGAGFRLGSPRDAARRGSHVSVHRADADQLTRSLIAAGVVPDFRPPDGIRLGLSPLTTRFADVWDGLTRLRELAA
ncbi:MAG TPA: kynureninase [Candidatus Limnocylindria bacterium]|nr:kynureninase [Candidatus Limnocylindria bacterium]